MFKRIFILIFMFLLGCSQQPLVKDSGNNTVNFFDYRGKWIVINYWATWCEACRREIPELNAFYFAHKDKDAVVFGVNYGVVGSVDQLSQAIDQMGVRFPTLVIDPKEIFDVHTIAQLPTTLLIAPDGRLKAVLIGEQTQKSLEKNMES